MQGMLSFLGSIFAWIGGVIECAAPRRSEKEVYYEFAARELERTIPHDITLPSEREIEFCCSAPRPPMNLLSLVIEKLAMA